MKGEPLLYVHGHRARLSPHDYLPEDRGYETLCWIWQLSLDTHGYGHQVVNGRLRLSHRVMYERERGPIPEGMHLDHLCRVPACINPDHLEPVTNAENARRGRTAKIDARKARVIRAVHGKMDAKNIGALYGITDSTVRRIWNGKLWS